MAPSSSSVFCQELGRLVGEMEPDLRRVRHRQQARMGADEGGAVGDRLHAASASMPA